MDFYLFKYLTANVNYFSSSADRSAVRDSSGGRERHSSEGPPQRSIHPNSRWSVIQSFILTD